MKRYVPSLLLLLFTVFFIGLYAYTVDPKLDLNGDNASYIKLARDLADGHGYSNQGLDGNWTPASHFPPGYPAILSVFVRLGVDSLMGFKVLNAVFFFLSVVILGFLIRKVTGQIYLAFSVSVLAVMSPSLLYFSGMAMSEMSYMAATMLSLLSLFLYRQQAGQRFYRSPWFYTAVVFAAGAYYIRTVGASIMFAVIVFYLFRKEWMAALSSVAGFVLCLLPWMIRNRMYGIEGRYMGTIMVNNPWRPEEGQISSVGEMLEKMVVDLNDTVVTGFKSLLFPYAEMGSGFFPVLWGIVVVVIVFWGAWNMGKLRWAVIAYLVANMGLFALWHGGNGTRYVTPLIPLLFALFFLGIWAGCVELGKRRNKVVGKDSLWSLLFLLFLFPMIKPVENLHVQSKKPYPQAYFHYFSIASAMNSSYPQGTVVCCRKPELFVYFAPNMLVTNYLYSLEPEKVIGDLCEKKVDYVVLEQLGYASTFRYLYPAIAKYPQFFTVVYHLENPDTYLFKFEKDLAEQQLRGEE